MLDKLTIKPALILLAVAVLGTSGGAQAHATETVAQSSVEAMTETSRCVTLGSNGALDLSIGMDGSQLWSGDAGRDIGGSSGEVTLYVVLGSTAARSLNVNISFASLHDYVVLHDASNDVHVAPTTAAQVVSVAFPIALDRPFDVLVGSNNMLVQSLAPTPPTPVVPSNRAVIKPVSTCPKP